MKNIGVVPAVLILLSLLLVGGLIVWSGQPAVKNADQPLLGAGIFENHDDHAVVEQARNDGGMRPNPFASSAVRNEPAADDLQQNTGADFSADTGDLAREQQQEYFSEYTETTTFNSAEETSQFDPLPQHSVTGGAGVLTWVPKQNNTSHSVYDNLALTVVSASGGGARIKQQFSNGEDIYVAESLPDGIYNWEMVVTPEISPDLRARMSEVRQAGNQEVERELMAELRREGAIPTRKQAQGNVQSGHFNIRDGVVVSDGKQEK